MKNALISTYAILLAALACLPAGAQTQQSTAPRLVSVSGTGEIKVKPDEAVLHMGVESRSKGLDEARKQTDEKVAGLIKTLRSQGIDPKDIQTTYMELYPGYGRDMAEPRIEYYTAHKSMTVVVRDLSKLEALQVALSKTGLNRISGIQFRTGELNRHRAQARKLAVAAAREKANALCAELGVKTGAVYSITELADDHMPRPMFNMQMEAAQQSGPDTTIEPGQITVSASVQVSFYIE